jgi:DNA-binding helix-hairpin-helix protein with protein kinase domain
MAVATIKPRTRSATVAAPTFAGTRSGNVYTLGQQIGAGGNGVVYAVARRPELVAKLQKQVLSAHDIDKLDVLVRAATPDLLSVAAWPIDGLKSRNGLMVGYLMPCIVDARPLYELYSPRARVQHFPSADFRFLVHAAANVARLFAAIHRAGFIAGDVNHSNVLVRANATVAAVDCDSFQVGVGSRFPCLVGTDLFVPPELLGATLGATPRTASHDAFGLAILIFHLLFMGRHPFAGRYLGKGDMPIERAIADSRFAYSRDIDRTRMAPPPYTPSMDAVGPAVMELFECAFHADARKSDRPGPEAWIDALGALKAALVPCKTVPWHYHLPAARQCAWCAIEQPTRTKLFGGIIKTTTAAIADLETLWARYLALTEPGPPRPLPKPSEWIRPPAAPRPWTRCCRGMLVAATALLALFVADMLWPIDLTKSWPEIAQQVANDRTQFAVFACIWIVIIAKHVIDRPGLGLPRPVSPLQRWRLWRAANAAWCRAAAAWFAQPDPPDVSDLRSPIEALKKDLDALVVERATRIHALAAPEREAQQRARYLAALRIESAKLANIGPARCAVLRSWGIDTAADVDMAKITDIPGFGKNLTDKLVIWRDIKEMAFVYNAAAVVDPLEVQRIDRQLAGRRTKLMMELRDQIGEMERRVGRFNCDRVALWAQVETAFNERMLVRRG